jgi:hypothetical protein
MIQFALFMYAALQQGKSSGFEVLCYFGKQNTAGANPARPAKGNRW